MTHLGGKTEVSLNSPRALPANLPSPDYIQEQMAKAWGFDFYLPQVDAAAI